jgi:hypothetical protein
VRDAFDPRKIFKADRPAGEADVAAPLAGDAS